MRDALRPILELSVVIPGLLLAYFPVRSYLKQTPGRLAAWLLPLLLALCVGGGLLCCLLRVSTALASAFLTPLAVFLYIRMLRISLWKSGTIALSVCAVFACVNSLSRAVSAAMVLRMQLPLDEPWFCFGACVFYNAVCWLAVAAAYYPSTHAVRAMVEDDNFARTWYVFWVLPLVFILLNLFMIPRYQTTLQTGRVLQGYMVLSIALLALLFWFNTIFLLMANSLNRNARLQQENQFLSMQQQRFDNLKNAIEEARQARHDMRHQLNQISSLAETGDLDGLKAYLAKTVSRIPNLDMRFCENRAADSVVGYYCALAKREDIPFHAQLDLPESLPLDEIDMCLVLSNLLENALEASLRTAPGKRQIAVIAYLHAERLLLIEVENAYDGEVREKDGVFREGYAPQLKIKPITAFFLWQTNKCRIAWRFYLAMRHSFCFSDHAEIAVGERGMSGVGLEEIQQQVGHFCADLPQNWTADVAVVAAGPAGAVAAEAGGENVAVRDGAAVYAKLCDAATGRAGAVKDVMHTGIVVVIVMLDLRLQKRIGNTKRSVCVPDEIFRAAFHRPAQDRTGDLQNRQCIRIGIGVQNIPAAHGLRQTCRVVGKTRDGDLRAACGQLHSIKQVCERGSVRSHVQRRIQRQRRLQMPDDLIEPVLRTALYL